MSEPAAEHACIVVGAGPGGLAVAGALEHRGVTALVVERDEVASSWRHRYERVHLNTSKWFSHLPGARFPADYPQFPARDQLVAYYEGYARDRRLHVLGGTEIRRIDRADGAWHLEIHGRSLRAQTVVVATGKDHTPTFPDVPGRESFNGALLHAAEYRNAEPYRGADALVLGAGNSGAEIATDLAEGGAERVRLSIRTPPNIIHRSAAGIPNDALAVLGAPLPPRIVDTAAWWIRRVTIGDLSRYGLARPPEGPYARLRRTGTIPTIDAGPFVRAVKQRQIEVVPSVARFDDHAVWLSDGRRIQPQVVVAATGYSAGLEPLVGHLGILDERGRPYSHDVRTHPRAPGLHFVGFTDPLSGNIRQMRLDAEKVADAIAASCA